MDLHPNVSAAAVAFLWGASPVVYRYATDVHGVTPTVIVMITAIVYFIAAVLTYPKDVVNVAKYGPWVVALIAVAAFMSMFVGNLLYLRAIERTSNVSAVVVMTSLYPVVTVVLACVFLGDTRVLRIRSAIGVALILAGVYLVTST